MPKFLLQFPHKHSSFHLAVRILLNHGRLNIEDFQELKSIASLFGIDTGQMHKEAQVTSLLKSYCWNLQFSLLDPFLRVWNKVRIFYKAPSFQMSSNQVYDIQIWAK